MKKSKLLVPVFRNIFKLLMKLCTMVLLISFASAAFNSLMAQQPQTRVVSGTVTDSNGEPVIGASVVVKGTSIGINTNTDGKFQITIPADSKILVITFIGMKQQEVEIAGKAAVTVQLAAETIGLDEVVVVGYGTQKKVTVTGAVASVNNAQLVQVPVANISTTLTGRSAGLLTVQRTGEPGEDATTLRIRGVGTFSGSQEPLIMVDGIEAQNYNNIDPNEIENIAILKDASATAVYGVRGANGVLLITTKRGKTGKPQISFSTNFATQTYTELRERMRAYDYAWGWQEARKYDSYISGAYVPIFTDQDLQAYKDHSDPLFHPDADWLHMILKDQSFQNQQNLNIRGGTESVKYFISAGLFTQGGLFNNTDLQPGNFDMQTKFKRYNFRSNFDFNITKRLTATVNISDQIENKVGINSADATALIREIAIANPITFPGLYNGQLMYVQSPVAGSIHPLTSLYNNGYLKRYRNYLNGSFRANYDLDFITKGLSVHGTVSYQNFNTHSLNFWKTVRTYTALKPTTYDPLNPSSDGAIIVPNNDDGPFSTGESVGKSRQTYAEFGLDYSRTFGDHSFTGLILYNQSKKFDPDLQYLIPSGYQGLVGRLAYDYMGRYLAEFNVGYNGTENFSPGKRFGLFPAVSAGWILSDEPFFPKNNIVSFVKFRASYGEVGNDKIGGARFLYSPSAYTITNGSTTSSYPIAYFWGIVGTSSTGYAGAREGKIGNEDVTWERAKKTDLGFELNLFKEKIKISADYFYESRDNILSSYQTIPEITGANPNLPAVNLGKMKNTGYDGEISISLKTGSFNYWIKANTSYAHNTVLFRDEVLSPYTYQMSTGQRYGQTFGPIESDNGKFYNSWLEVSEAYRPKSGYQNNRIQPGDINWKDINGDGVYDQYDSGPIGYSDFPELNFGISIGGDFKGFDCSVLFQGASLVTFGINNNFRSRWNAFSGMPLYHVNSWSLERYQNGEKIVLPRYYVEGGGTVTSNQSGTVWQADASYVRLKNAELGYTITKNNLFSAVGISSVRIYINGSNLWTLAPDMHYKIPGVDPEQTPAYYGSGNNEAYPKTRTINFGANINF